MTLYYAGSVYCDTSIWRAGMIGEGINNSSVLVVKSHRLYVSSLGASSITSYLHVYTYPTDTW